MLTKLVATNEHYRIINEFPLNRIVCSNVCNSTKPLYELDHFLGIDRFENSFMSTHTSTIYYQLLVDPFQYLDYFQFFGLESTLD